jgi:hypothetical protein
MPRFGSERQADPFLARRPDQRTLRNYVTGHRPQVGSSGVNPSRPRIAGSRGASRIAAQFHRRLLSARARAKSGAEGVDCLNRLSWGRRAVSERSEGDRVDARAGRLENKMKREEGCSGNIAGVNALAKWVGREKAPFNQCEGGHSSGDFDPRSTDIENSQQPRVAR